jgi:hypothetical protein
MLLNIAYLCFGCDVYEDLSMHVSIILFFNKLSKQHERYTSDEDISSLIKFHLDDLISQFFKHLHSVITFHFYSVVEGLYSAVQSRLNFSQKTVLIVYQEIAAFWVINNALLSEIDSLSTVFAKEKFPKRNFNSADEVSDSISFRRLVLQILLITQNSGIFLQLLFDLIEYLFIFCSIKLSCWWDDV